MTRDGDQRVRDAMVSEPLSLDVGGDAQEAGEALTRRRGAAVLVSTAGGSSA